MPPFAQATGQVVICCRVPNHASEADIARWRAEASSRGVAVTWCVAPSDVGDWLAAGSTASQLAVRIGHAQSDQPLGRGEIREALREQRLSAAVLEGDRPLDHRRLLVEHGIEAVVTERLHPVDRQSRRPAPQGWDCRCVLWGLWEAGYTAPRKRLFGLLNDSRPQAGRLSIVSTGCRDGSHAEAGLAHLRQTVGRLQASLRSHSLEACLLADLPARLQGGTSREDQRSILAAA